MLRRTGWFTLLVCSWSAAADLSGKVTRSDTGAAVSGAVVIVRGTALFVVSDGQGAYRIGDIPAGSYGISCSAPGLRGVSTGAVWIGDAAQRDFALSPPEGPGTIQGVASCSGGPCAGVLVQARQGGNVRGESISQPETGAFSLVGLPPGNYNLRGLKIGYLPASAEVALPEPATDGGTVLAEQNLELGAGGSYQLSGVVGLSDNPLDKSGSQVRLNGSQPLSTATTSSGGSYQIAVPAGPLSLTASRAGYRSHVQIDVLVAGSRNLNFVLQKDEEPPQNPRYTVSGRVSLATDGGNVPAFRARVSIWREDGALQGSTLANGEGNYSIGGLPPDTYRAGALAEGYREQVSEPFSLRANRALDFTLEPDTQYNWGPGVHGPGAGCGCNAVPPALVVALPGLFFLRRGKKHVR